MAQALTDLSAAAARRCAKLGEALSVGVDDHKASCGPLPSEGQDVLYELGSGALLPPSRGAARETAPRSRAAAGVRTR
jgi:hypothetical protein